MKGFSSDHTCVLVTGGAGFIGSNFVNMCREEDRACIINLDKLTYAGNLSNLVEREYDDGHVFVRGDIADRKIVKHLLERYRPSAVVNFAAESHVDRSIDSPGEFVHTNVVGTFNLLEEVRCYWDSMGVDSKEKFRFLHVSTDEVYGSLEMADAPFSESDAYLPNSPYSASKAASDHFVRSYYKTYSLPVLTTNCSNNYGPYQFPEKLIPLIIINALEEKPLPIYGDGLNVRDWIYVEDHCRAVWTVLTGGERGHTYNIGGRCERTNKELVSKICEMLDVVSPRVANDSYKSLITYVKDRPGHDRRYAIDDSKIVRELNWQPRESLESGLKKTVEWYLKNDEWVTSVRDGSYREWMERNYISVGRV